MRVGKILSLAFIALIFQVLVEAKRSGGSRSSRGGSWGSRSGGWGSRSRSNYSRGSFGTNVMIIGVDGRSYYGSPSMCPYGCAVNGRCGTEKECKIGGIVGIVFGILFCLCCCGCCIGACVKGKNKAKEHYSSHSSSVRSALSQSSLKPGLEPLIGGHTPYGEAPLL